MTVSNWSMAHFWKVTGWQDRTFDEVPVRLSPAVAMGDVMQILRDVQREGRELDARYPGRPLRLTNRNPFPGIVLFPWVADLEVAAFVWSRRVRAAVDCLTGRMDLELGYDDDGWD